MSTQEQPVLVVDMTTLRFRSDSSTGALRVTLRDGTVLGAVHPRRKELRSDLAFRAMDEALRHAAIFEPDSTNPALRRKLKLALYNPFSADVAYQATPGTTTFTSGAPLELDADGTPGMVDQSPHGSTLRVGARVLPGVERAEQDIARVVLSQA